MTDDPRGEIKKWVDYYRVNGLNILPAKFKQKSPKGALLRWEEYQTTFPDEKTVKTWLMEDKYQNIFMVLGSISNSTVEIDVDVPDVTLEDLFTDPEEAKKKVWIAESSMGKKKIYIKAEKVLDLPDQRVSDESYMVDEKEKFPHVEYRGEKKGSILPPSVHPSGVRYRWLNLNENGELPELSSLDSEKLFNEIVSHLRKKFNYTPPAVEPVSVTEKKRKKRPRFCFIESHDAGDLWNGQMGDEFRVAVAAELINCNFTDEQIHTWFQEHDAGSGEPYDKEKTQERLQNIRKRGLHSYSCEKLKNRCGDIVKKYCDSCSKKETQTIITCNYQLPGGKYLEQIYDNNGEGFILYDKNTDTWETVSEYRHGDVIIKPVLVKPEQKFAVVLPDGIEEYGTLEQLTEDMLKFALTEYDPVDFPELYELSVTTCFTSWVSPAWQRGLPERFIPILNARGPSETGKKRFLTICRWLCYHSVYALKTNRVPTLFRAVAPLEGTLIMDEADMDDSSLSNELVEFLNSRCDGVPIARYSSDSQDVEWWNSFGLTVMATRAGFKDDGLESRCIVMPTGTTESPEKYHLIPPPEWVEKGKRLQRKLLLFKLRHIEGEMPTQLLIPNVSSFRVRESLLIMQGLKDEDPSLLQKIERLAKGLQERIIKERAASPEGLILNFVYNYLSEDKTHLEHDGIGYIVVQEATKKVKDDADKKDEQDERIERIYYPLTLRRISEGLGSAFSSSDIARMWRGFNQDTLSQKKIDNKRHRGVIQIKNLARLDKVFPKYIPEYETLPVMTREFELSRQAPRQTRFGEKVTA